MLIVIAAVALLAIVLSLRALYEIRVNERIANANFLATKAKIEAMDAKLAEAHNLAHTAFADARKARSARK